MLTQFRGFSKHVFLVFVSHLQGLVGDISSLQLVERFYLEFLSIPRVEQRLAVLIFAKSFQPLITDLHRGIAIISEACEEIRSSQRVRLLLKKVAKIGRKLSGDDSFSFSVSSLLKMGDTKARDKSTSLLHFFVSVTDSDVLNYEADLPSLSYVCRLSIAALEDEVRQTSAGLQLLRDELSLCSRDDSFAKLFKEQEMRRAMDDVKISLAECRAIFEQLVLFFGEDPADFDVFQFFSIFVNFKNLIAQTQKAIATKADAEKKKQRTITATKADAEKKKQTIIDENRKVNL